MAAESESLAPALAERERVLRAIREHEAELRALGVAKLWLFGSLARGDVSSRSDVDVLVSVPPAQEFSLLDLAGVRVELCDLLGREADVVIREDVLPRFWRTIEGVWSRCSDGAAPVADRLRHILDAIARIEALTAGKTLENYMGDWVARDAVERNLERVSEASRHIPAEIKTRHKHVPWRSVAGLGNILRHDYPQVKDPRVWRIVRKDLAPLKAAVEAMLREADTDPDQG